MTHEEIEEYRNRLSGILGIGDRDADARPSIENELVALAMEIGAGTTSTYVHPTKEKEVSADASIAELARNIHQALQTAAMIDACQTAAKNYETARRAQESARLSQWVSIAAMFAAVATAIAAWVWH